MNWLRYAVLHHAAEYRPVRRDLEFQKAEHHLASRFQNPVRLRRKRYASMRQLRQHAEEHTMSATPAASGIATSLTSSKRRSGLEQTPCACASSSGTMSAPRISTVRTCARRPDPQPTEEIAGVRQARVQQDLPHQVAEGFIFSSDRHRHGGLFGAHRFRTAAGSWLHNPQS